MGDDSLGACVAGLKKYCPGHQPVWTAVGVAALAFPGEFEFSVFGGFMGSEEEEKGEVVILGCMANLVWGVEMKIEIEVRAHVPVEKK